jgi:prepilin-type N-terminal cleavage/methylation domain-containing protein
MKISPDHLFRINKDDGFTLLELMIVIGLIGLLTLIAFPNFRSVRDDQTLYSEAEKVESDLRYMQEIAFDTQNTCTMTYGANSYQIQLNASTLKSESLDNNVWFQGSGSIQMGENGLPAGASFPVTITLIKNDLKVNIQISAGGKIEL